MVVKTVKARSEKPFLVDNFIFFNHTLFCRGFYSRAKEFLTCFICNNRGFSWSYFLFDNIFTCHQDSNIEQWQKNVLDSSHCLCPNDRQSYLCFVAICVYKKTDTQTSNVKPLGVSFKFRH